MMGQRSLIGFGLIIGLMFGLCSRVIGQSAARPVVKGAGKPFEVFEVEANACAKLVTKTGARICIPEKACLTSDGLPVQGKITIHYREFRQPTDAIISGYHLIYRTEAAEFQLESDGMFEIYATHNNKPLKIAPDKAITVSILKRSWNNFNFFYFDPSTKQWQLRQPTKDTAAFGDALGPRLYSTVDEKVLTPKEKADSLAAATLQNALEAENTIDTSSTKFEKTFKDFYRTQNINKFGLYNYARIIEMDNAVRIIASFTFEEQLPYKNALIFVVYPELNSVFQFPMETWSEKFYLLAGKRSFKLFAFNYDTGAFYYLDPEDAKSIPLVSLSGKPYLFKLKKYERTIQNFTQARKAINFE